MAQVNMQQVKELRDRTQAGLNDCRGALMEADGEMEKAVEIILKKGLAKSAKRAGAVASEGTVAAQVAADGKSGVLIEVNIQTDFAARNDDFVTFAKNVLELASRSPKDADLLTLPYPAGGGTVEEVRQALVGKLGENITVRRWEKFETKTGIVHSYVHLGGKIGVLLQVEVGNPAVLTNAGLLKFIDDTAMQVAAMAPLCLSTADVPADEKAKQTDIYNAQLADEGKPEKARPKIIEGKLAKWMKEICLLEQVSVLDSEKTIQQQLEAVAKEVGTTLTIARFVRYERGEGIVDKKKSEDFAAEVMKMTQA
ncbi:MAG TPA: translation elongation factor Ts [Polyangiaceae bacterium]|nr:translation elongation factor Ts [Polyangiaceae bacterium]